MRIVSGIIGLGIAILALIGFFVVVVLLQEEALPRLLSWWKDVQEGHAHYQGVRLERRIKEEAIGAAVRNQEAVEIAKQRMRAALERPLSSPAKERVGWPPPTPRPPA